MVKVNYNHTVIELINAIQKPSIGADLEVAQEAIPKAIAIDIDLIDGSPRFQVVNDDLPVVGTAKIELPGVVRKGTTHVGAIFQPPRRFLPKGRKAIHCLRFRGGDDLKGIAGQEDHG